VKLIHFKHLYQFIGRKEENYFEKRELDEWNVVLLLGDVTIFTVLLYYFDFDVLKQLLEQCHNKILLQ